MVERGNFSFRQIDLSAGKRRKTSDVIAIRMR